MQNTQDRSSCSLVTGVCAGMAVGHRDCRVGRPGAQAVVRPVRRLLRLPAGERRQ